MPEKLDKKKNRCHFLTQRILLHWLRTEKLDFLKKCIFQSVCIGNRFKTFLDSYFDTPIEIKTKKKNYQKYQFEYENLYQTKLLIFEFLMYSLHSFILKNPLANLLP